MKDINTLIPDIYSLVQRKDGWFNDQLARSFSQDLGTRLQSQLGENTSRGTLRLSQMGARCPRAVWYSVHHPEMAEPLPPWVEIKYSFGHILEALVITLAKAAGHEVTGEQDELILDDIVGHRDCVINGYTVDVKSTSSIGFTKFETGKFDDIFGYLDQLDGYVLSAKDDPLVKHKDKGFLLAIDKQLGHMCLYPHEVTHERAERLRARIAYYCTLVTLKDPPPCECKVISQGSSGNLQLDLKASYSSYKYCCFPDLRTFKYANGPVFLTRVVKRPFNQYGPIPEIDKHGQLIYNG